MPDEVAEVTNVLEINGLTLSYSTAMGVTDAVRDVSLHLKPGEILGIVGESGAGKSTILSAVTQLINYPGYLAAGSVRLNGEELRGKSDKMLCKIRGKDIGVIFQDPLTALNPVVSIGKQLIRSIKLSSGLARADARRRAIELIEQVGIPNPEDCLNQYPHQFSGGMRQRLVIAIALSGNPALLIADEPTTALDVSIQSEILDIIQALCRERKIGVLLITHDMGVINQVADRVTVMRHGHVVEQNSTLAIINYPEHPYTKALISAVPRTDKKLPRFKLFGEENVDVISKQAYRRTERHGYAPAVSISTPIVEIKNVGKTYLKRKAIFNRNNEYITALDDVSLDIRTGEIFGMVGESGSGKSTVAKILCGLESASSGSIRYKGKDISSLANEPQLRTECLDMQMVFQDPFSSLNPRQRIGTLLAEPMQVHGHVAKADIQAVVVDMLDKVSLEASVMNKLPHQLSGGQRQRICIARALVMHPRFLICDEPTSALDVVIQAQVLNLLKKLQEELHLTILFISHDLAVIRHMCDRVAVMKAGRLCEIADVEALFETPSHDYTKRLLRLMPQFTTNITA